MQRLCNVVMASGPYIASSDQDLWSHTNKLIAIQSLTQLLNCLDLSQVRVVITRISNFTSIPRNFWNTEFGRVSDLIKFTKWNMSKMILHQFMVSRLGKQNPCYVANQFWIEH